MARKKRYTQFAVLGLGRFGMSIVQTLARSDVSIMAIDIEETRVQQAAEYATHAVQLDVTDERALDRIGLGNFEVVILAIGEDFEASMIAAMIAKERGVKRIIVKALSNRQKAILERIGVDEVILPEMEMGAKLARRLTGSHVMDILEESDLYTITEMRPLEEWVDKTIQQADIRRKHRITILGIRRGERLRIPVMPDMVIQREDVLITLSENER